MRFLAAIISALAADPHGLVALYGDRFAPLGAARDAKWVHDPSLSIRLAM
jgi:hypothetical protein